MCVSGSAGDVGMGVQLCFCECTLEFMVDLHEKYKAKTTYSLLLLDSIWSEYCILSVLVLNCPLAFH
jgi:hypothetical protein